MSNYVVQGKLGTGKGKFAVNVMRTAMRETRRVATNCDLFLDKLLAPDSKATAIRVPDKPTAADLLAIGHGCTDEEKYNEDRYGVMVLDELGSWLNARSHASPDRAAFIDFIIHARKQRWHVYFIVQDLEMIDRQVRSGLVEYNVRLVRADKLRIPVVGALLGKAGKLKGLHIATTTLVEMPGFVVDRDWFKGTDLQDGYDTLQSFRDWARDPAHPNFQGERYAGPYSYLSSWHLKGRHERSVPKQRNFVQRAIWRDPPAAKPQLKPKSPLIARLESRPVNEAWRLAVEAARVLAQRQAMQAAA
ncbi:MAG: zonular occludens toxin domain-containing protein [Pseudomonadales bacterium]